MSDQKVGEQEDEWKKLNNKYDSFHSIHHRKNQTFKL